jgi:hypothetical protein
MTGKGIRKMKKKNEILKMLRYFCLLWVIVFGLMAIIGSGGGDDESNTGTLYQYEYDGSGNLVNTTAEGDCNCDFSDGECNREYNSLGQLIEACIIGDRPSPCADTKYYYNYVGLVSAIEYSGSCDCPSGGSGTVVCDATYNSFSQLITACICEY